MYFRKQIAVFVAYLVIHSCERIFIRQVFALGDQVGPIDRIPGFIFPPIHNSRLGLMATLEISITIRRHLIKKYPHFSFKVTVSTY